MPGPWEKFAQPSAPWERYGGTAPAQQSALSPHQYTADEVTGGGFLPQVEQEAFGTRSAPPNEGIGQHILRDLSNFGGAAAGAIPEMLMHPVKTAQSVAHLEQAAAGDPTGLVNDVTPLIQSAKANPEDTAVSTLGNLTGAAAFGGGLGDVAEPVAGGLRDLIPSKARAGDLFQSVMKDAGDQPVNLTRSMEPLERAQQLSARGHGTVSAADNLYKRINTVNPLTYGEARDWASGLSRLSGQDLLSGSKSLISQVKQLGHALNEDIGDTASSVGRGEDYTKAMRDWRRASQLSDLVDNVKKYAPVAGISALAGAGAAKGYNFLKNLTQ